MNFIPKVTRLTILEKNSTQNTHCWTPGDRKALAKLYSKQTQISKSLLVSDIINFQNALCFVCFNVVLPAH